jgi:hypothetical protein
MADYPVFDRFRVERNTDGTDGYLTDSDNYSALIKREVRLEAHLSNTMAELAELLLSKHKDYGPKNISQAPGGALNGLRVRMHDKSARINHLIDNNASPQHESLEDSFKDMANYAIIGLLVLRGQWDTE